MPWRLAGHKFTPPRRASAFPGLMMPIPIPAPRDPHKTPEEGPRGMCRGSEKIFQRGVLLLSREEGLSSASFELLEAETIARHWSLATAWA